MSSLVAAGEEVEVSLKARRWNLVKRLLLILHFSKSSSSSSSSSHLKTALEQWRILRNTAYFAMPKIVIFRPLFNAGVEGINYTKGVEFKAPHRVSTTLDHKWVNVFASSQPISSGIVAFGVRLDEKCASNPQNCVAVGVSPKIEVGSNLAAHPGYNMPGCTIFLHSGYLYAGSGANRTILDQKISQQPKSVCIVRIDFATRIITFFVNGIEAATSQQPVTIPASDKTLYAAVSFYKVDDEIETLAEDDPAFAVLFPRE